MPEGRPFPYKYFPKRGVKLSVTFGKPIRDEDVKMALSHTIESDELFGVTSSELSLGVPREEAQSRATSESGWLGKEIRHAEQEGETSEEMSRKTARIRSAVTAVLHRNVEALGRQVLGLRTQG